MRQDITLNLNAIHDDFFSSFDSSPWMSASLYAVEFNTYHLNAYLELNEEKNHHHLNTFMYRMRTKLDNSINRREGDKIDRGRMTRNFLVNSINVNFDRNIVGTFHSCGQNAKTATEMEIATTLPLGAT